MQYNLLLRGGTVVDGTGAPASRMDVRVRNGVIAEVGAGLEAGTRERVIDARGCYVTPGFIETHNHFDAPMWWTPTLDPMPGYGVTTSVNGNCGFSAAPASDDPEARLEMVKIFSFFEDIPIKPFLEVLPWDWRRWSEYKHSLQTRLKFTVNVAAFVGHIAIRLAVMGLESWERKARPEEVVKMSRLLDDALGAGALGLSTNLLDYDSRNRPVPSMVADDAEFEALLDVLAKYPGASFQVIVGTFSRQSAVADVERMAGMCAPRRIRMQWLGLPTYEFQAELRELMFAMHERFKAEGHDIWTSVTDLPATTAVSFQSSLTFAQSNIYVWHEIIAAPTEEAKLALLADPAWRARARDSWEQCSKISPFCRPAEITLLESESGFGPVDITLAEFMARHGVPNPSDALAEWVLDNGVRSTLLMKPWPKNRASCLKLFRDPRAIGNVSDAGAHGQMLCGIGDNINLLTDYVRDSQALSLEEGIHNLTGKLADFFGFTDRGEIKVGKRADLVVFDLDAIERRPVEKVFDVPDGEGGRTWRYSRAPAPMLLTLVNGVPTFDKGRFTGLFPGEILAPTLRPRARAAA
jgi:N-acyl-D-aspartate/D-glutamate deacylase